MSCELSPIVHSRVMAPEHFMEAIRGANMEACQLSKKPAPSDLSRVMLPGACLDFANVGPSMLFSGAMPANCYTMLFVRSCPEVGRSFNFGMEHTDGYLGVFAAGAAFDAVAPEKYGTATLTVPVDEFHHRYAAHLPGPARSLFDRGAGLRIPASEQARLHSVLTIIDAMFDDPAQPLTDLEFRRNIERSVFSAFLAALVAGAENRDNLRSERTMARHRRLRQARDYLAAHAHRPVYLGDLCTALGLGHRGVENLFRDLLGLSPTAYLRHQRLHGARRALRKATAAPGTVKRIALEWGFWHLGHFAADYRKLFGESPNATLAAR